MNITSCDGCGVVLDKDNLGFPDDIRDYEGVVYEDKAVWDGESWVAIVPCPVCKNPIKEFG
jgi:hypothetical protein